MTAGGSTRETRDSASEIKFLLPAETAARLRERARGLLAPDPYAGGPDADQYTTTTIYFDTADFAVYGRRGSYRRAKYRVRRYGAGDIVFLERKLRTSDYLSKRRSTVRIEDLPLLTQTGAESIGGQAVETGADAGWNGGWFRERLAARKLGAVCQIAYQRTARVGMTDYGPIRLTVDEHLTGLALDVPEFRAIADGQPILQGTIVEMKFRAAMPAVFKQIVEEFALMPESVSKYRLGIQATRPDVVAAAAARKAAAIEARTSNA